MLISILSQLVGGYFPLASAAELAVASVGPYQVLLASYYFQYYY
jgi:hypothetical protein